MDEFDRLKSEAGAILTETRSRQLCIRRLVEQGHDEVVVRAAVEAVLEERRETVREAKSSSRLAQAPRMSREQVKLSLAIQGVLGSIATGLLAASLFGGFHPLVAVIGFPGYFFEPVVSVLLVGYIVWKRLTD